MVEWSEKWQVKFNIDKCKVLHLRHNNMRSMCKMGSIEMQSTPVEKDLGVYVDGVLKFRDHVSHRDNEFSQLLGFIRTAIHDPCYAPPGIWKYYMASQISD